MDGLFTPLDEEDCAGLFAGFGVVAGFVRGRKVLKANLAVDLEVVDIACACREQGKKCKERDPEGSRGSYHRFPGHESSNVEGSGLKILYNVYDWKSFFVVSTC